MMYTKKQDDEIIYRVDSIDHFLELFCSGLFPHTVQDLDDDSDSLIFHSTMELRLPFLKKGWSKVSHNSISPR